MTVIETDRLTLRKLTLDDAPFILRLVNEPSWIQNIGDKGVRNLEDARKYLCTGPMDMYERRGFGLYMIELKDGDVPIGMCGLIKRDSLQDVDIGYALLPEYWGKGYAHEAVTAVLAYGKRKFGLNRIVAIVSPGNASSIRVLEKVGMQFESMLELSEDNPVELFGLEL